MTEETPHREASPVVTHGDQTLRHAAETMAVHGVTTLSVVDREDPTLVIGTVSLPQLLAARRRDQQEALRARARAAAPAAGPDRPTERPHPHDSVGRRSLPRPPPRPAPYPRPRGRTSRACGVVGAGIVGLAVARRLAAAARGEVTVFEKERRRRPPDRPQLRRRARRPLLHAGLAEGRALPARPRPDPGLLRRARPAVRRVRQARRRRRRGGAGGCADIEQPAPGATACPGCAGSTRRSSARIEPHAAGVAGAALAARPRSSTTGAIARALPARRGAAGGAVLLGAAVTGIGRAGDGGPRRAAGERRHALDRLVVCAGLQSDRVARLAGATPARRSCRSAASTDRLRARARAPRARPDLPGARPALPVPRRALHPPGRRRRRGRAERLPRPRPRGLRALATLARATCARPWPGPASGGGPAALAHRAWPSARLAVEPRLHAGARRYVPESPPPTCGRPAGVRAQAVDRDGTLVDDFRITAGPASPSATPRRRPRPRRSRSPSTSCEALL